MAPKHYTVKNLEWRLAISGNESWAVRVHFETVDHFEIRVVTRVELKRWCSPRTRWIAGLNRSSSEASKAISSSATRSTSMRHSTTPVRAPLPPPSQQNTTAKVADWTKTPLHRWKWRCSREQKMSISRHARSQAELSILKTYREVETSDLNVIDILHKCTSQNY